MEVELALAMLEAFDFDDGRMEKCLSAVSTTPYVSVSDTDKIPKRKSKPERGEGDDVKAKVKKHELQTNKSKLRTASKVTISRYLRLVRTILMPLHHFFIFTQRTYEDLAERVGWLMPTIEKSRLLLLCTGKGQSTVRCNEACSCTRCSKKPGLVYHSTCM